jgi:hypothetical protein
MTEFTQDPAAKRGLTLPLCAELADTGGDADAVGEIARRAKLRVEYEDYGDTDALGTGELSGGQFYASFSHRDRRLTQLITDLWVWELPDEEDYDTPEKHQAAQARFHELFQQERAKAVDLLGEPDCDGQDPDERGFRYAVWRRKSALFTLGQTDFDPQFGERVIVCLDFERLDTALPLTAPYSTWIAMEEDGVDA